MSDLKALQETLDDVQGIQMLAVLLLNMLLLLLHLLDVYGNKVEDADLEILDLLELGSLKS